MAEAIGIAHPAGLGPLHDGARRDGGERIPDEPPNRALAHQAARVRASRPWSIWPRSSSLNVLGYVIAAGQAGNSRQMIPVLETIRVSRPGPGRPRTRPDRVLGGKVYSSRASRAYLASRSIKATIAIPADQARHRRARGADGGRPPAFDTTVYCDRYAVECGISALKHKRAFATRNDKLAVRYAATVTVANIDRWLK